MKPRDSAVWGVLLALYALFFSWYTSCGGPLEAEEVERYVARMAERGADAAQLARFRDFLESDTGDDFVMLNVIEMHAHPPRVDGEAPGTSAATLLGRYMSFMWPALLARASHPVLFGRAAGEAPEVWGIENGRSWSTAGAMRYRSRRDLMEIATDPDFRDAHVYKIAAMAKTIAFPVDPWWQLGDPRLVLALALACLGSAIGVLRGGVLRVDSGRETVR